MTKQTDFFLGANSASGFYSLYDQLGNLEQTYDFLVLKGGPGVGKSTLMKQIGKQAQDKGLQVEYTHCSGDPASLDAVQLPQLRCAIADGTAPHVIEPRYPAAVDRYVDLGRFYDVDRLKERRKEIVACTDGYKAEYARAYDCLRAHGAIRGEIERQVAESANLEKLRKRVGNIWQRERPRRSKGTGKEARRFLGGLTPAGYACCTDTIYTLCDKVYELQDSYRLAAPVLEHLRQEILAGGCDVVTCLDPAQPGRIEHLLLPQLRLAFVTTGRHFTLTEKPYRCLRLDRLIDREQYRLMRGGLRLKERLADALEEEGAEHLRLAGEKHQELELIYHPFVDFDGVMELAAQEAARIFGNL